MVENDPQRFDAKERLEALESMVDTEDEIAPAADHAPSEADTALLNQRTRRRAGQKQQFTEWLKSIDRDTGAKP